MTDKPEPPKPQPPPAAEAGERKSGRVRFDERGQAVWEWAVRTGLYDRNASTSRVRALTEDPVKLEIADTLEQGPKPAAPSGNPYEHPAPAPKSNERRSFDPYARDPRPPKAPARPGPGRKR